MVGCQSSCDGCVSGPAWFCSKKIDGLILWQGVSVLMMAAYQGRHDIVTYFFKLSEMPRHKAAIVDLVCFQRDSLEVRRDMRVAQHYPFGLVTLQSCFFWLWGEGVLFTSRAASLCHHLQAAVRAYRCGGIIPLLSLIS